MTGSEHPTASATSASAQDPDHDATAKPAIPAAASGACVTATHEALYADTGPACDGCGAAVASATRAAGPSLLWVRGDQRELEPRSLCESCAAAIAITQLRAAEADEDEEG